MPAGGDNKPKLEKSGDQAKIVKVEAIRHNLSVALAVIVFLVSFVAGCFFAIQPKVEFLLLAPCLILFIGSIYYLYSKS